MNKIEDISRERSNSYDSDLTESSYDSDNEIIDTGLFDDDDDYENEKNKKDGANFTPEIISQSATLAVEYNIDKEGKLSIPYGIFMECKQLPDGNIICKKEDFSNVATNPNIENTKKTKKNKRQILKQNKTKKRNVIGRRNISKRKRVKRRVGTKRVIGLK